MAHEVISVDGQSDCLCEATAAEHVVSEEHVVLEQTIGHDDIEHGVEHAAVAPSGRVEDSVVVHGPTMVVDAGAPQSKGIDAEGQVASRKFWTAKQKEKRISQMKAAEQMGIKVIAIEPFLDMLGLQVESVRANRLPVPLDRNAAPARTENVAF